MINKIICLGDSITKGKVWKENERRPYITENSYPVILRKLLNVDVENEGVCDVTTDFMLKHIGCDIYFEKGSVVIIEIGGNDCNLNWREIKKDPEGSHDAVVPIAKFKENMLEIINKVMSYGARPVISTLPPLDADRYYSLLQRVFTDRIKPWIDRNGGIYKWQERYSDAVKAIAHMIDVPIIDIRKAFLDTKNYKKYMSFDGIHPNEDGYAIIANECCRGLKSIFT